MTHGIRLRGNAITNAGSDLKILVLPSNAKDDVPITFHDEDGNDYQVPADTVFVPILIRPCAEFTANINIRIGESASGDGAIATERVYVDADKISNTAQYPYTLEDLPFLYFAASTYITAETTSTNVAYELIAGSLIVGLEFSTS